MNVGKTIALFAGASTALLGSSASFAAGLQTLYAFSACTQGPSNSCVNNDGAQAYAGVIQAVDGNLYGVAETGGVNGTGTIFRLTPSGQFTALYNFGLVLNQTAWDGGHPMQSLVQASNANFYGVTLNGGYFKGWNPYGFGTAFEISPQGLFQVVHTFGATSNGMADPTDGLIPNSPLLQASNGNLYGTTDNDGDYMQGTIYSISPTGTYAQVYVFNPSSGASAPGGKLAQGSDGNIYGTSFSGGGGSAFKVSPTGQYTLLHTFTQTTDGSEPTGLILGKDGNFYGTASAGGAAGQGTLFKMAADGTFTTLHSFNYSDGSAPGPIIQGTDGYFYGATSSGGANGAGTIFKMSTLGQIVTLYSFSAPFNNTNTDGASPNAVIQGKDGNLYGTTHTAGANSNGTVFEVIIQKPTLTFKASPAYVSPSQPSKLTWSSTSATTCSAGGNWSGTEPTAGSQTVVLTTPNTYAYTLTCTGPAGSVKKTVKVTVK